MKRWKGVVISLRFKINKTYDMLVRQPWRNYFPTTGSCCRRVVSCVHFSIEKPVEVLCLELCAATLFVLLLKFGAVLNIICGFLIAVCWWRHITQCTIIVWSFLRLLKLRKLAVCKLDLLRGSFTRCHSVLDHGLNLHRNILLTSGSSSDLVYRH